MKQMQISIPTPCHENWHAMLPEEKGRFCLSCQKTVIDFSNMNDAEILKYIAGGSKNLCGKFSPDQLGRDITEQPGRKRNVFRYAWNMAVAFLIFSAKTSAQVKPAKDNIVCGPATKVNEGQGSMVLGKMIADSRVIKGRVTDTDGNAIPFASVYIKNGKYGQSCDANGAFRITVTSSQYDTLVFSAVGYTLKEVSLNRQVSNDSLLVQLKGHDMTGWLGGAVVITKVKRRKPVFNLFKKKETPVCVKPVAVEPKLSIFPNPAPVLQEVKMQLKDLALGQWQMNLYNSAGKLLLTDLITISSADQTSSISAVYTKMAGLYVIELTNASLNKKVTGKLLVQ